MRSGRRTSAWLGGTRAHCLSSGPVASGSGPGGSESRRGFRPTCAAVPRSRYCRAIMSSLGRLRRFAGRPAGEWRRRVSATLAALCSESLHCGGRFSRLQFHALLEIEICRCDGREAEAEARQTSARFLRPPVPSTDRPAACRFLTRLRGQSAECREWRDGVPQSRQEGSLCPRTRLHLGSDIFTGRERSPARPGPSLATMGYLFHFRCNHCKMAATLV